MVTLIKVRHIHGVIHEDEWIGERIDWFIEEGNHYECVATTELHHSKSGKHKTYTHVINLPKSDLELIKQYVEQNFKEGK